MIKHGSRERLKKRLQGSVMSNDFEYVSMLGQGGFGFVIKVKKKSTGKLFAMKLQTKLSMLNNTKCLKSSAFDELTLHMERSVMAECCDHPFITSLHYAFTTDTCAALIMDLASCGTLRDYLHTLSSVGSSNSLNNGIPESAVRQLVVEIALALDFLHRKGVMYRDLKPANILLCSDGHCLLCDFGLAGRIIEETTESELTNDDSDEMDILDSTSSTDRFDSGGDSGDTNPGNEEISDNLDDYGPRKHRDRVTPESLYNIDGESCRFFSDILLATLCSCHNHLIYSTRLFAFTRDHYI